MSYKKHKPVRLIACTECNKVVDKAQLIIAEINAGEIFDVVICKACLLRMIHELDKLN